MQPRGTRLRYLNALPRLLLTLPFLVRLGVAVLSILSFLILYMFFAPAARNPSILAVPMALVAWMFRRRGVWICLVSMLLTLWVFYTIETQNILLTPSLIRSFVAATLALLIVGLLISSQRDSLELANAARLETIRAYEEQQKLHQAKDQFLQNVNHELRTPLTAVSGYIELVLEHGEHLDPAMQKDYLKNALYCCEELQLLTNNILDTLQIDNARAELNLEILSVANVAREVIEHTDPRRLQEYSIQVDTPEELLVWANAQYMRQVLRNLLSNALKYAPPGTPIVISAFLDEHVVQTTLSKPQVCIGVKDAGPGIPPDEIPLLFEQFVRLQRDLSGKIRGSGLGLYISKQLVEAMGGRIWVESEGIPGKGSCFYFTLPSVSRAEVSTNMTDEVHRVVDAHP